MEPEIHRNKTAAETINEMPANRTLFVEKFTHESPVRPEIVHGLRTIQEVFAHYRPKVEVRLQTHSGMGKSEVLKFNAIEDFDIEGVIRQSKTLRQLKIRREEYMKLAHLIGADEKLRGVLKNSEAKQGLLQCIKTAIKELQNNQ